MRPQNLRDVFWDVIYEYARKDSNIVIVSADLGAMSLDKFRKDMPTQFINVGIAEQNAIAVAAGLALAGKKVYVYACAPFITLRCYEQIRLTLAGMNLPITVVGQGAGFSFSEFGPTHHVVEDIGVIRMLPHVKMYNLSDPIMTKVIANNSIKGKSPEYIRIDKLAPPALYKTEQEVDYDKGFGVLEESNNILFIATGNTVIYAKEAMETLREQGVESGLIDLYCMKPNKELLLKELAKCNRIITIEEHSLPCGMGSMLCELMMDNKLYIDISRVAVDTSKGYCYEYGGRENIQRLFGISSNNLVEVATK